MPGVYPPLTPPGRGVVLCGESLRSRQTLRSTSSIVKPKESPLRKPTCRFRNPPLHGGGNLMKLTIDVLGVGHPAAIRISRPVNDLLSPSVKARSMNPSTIELSPSVPQYPFNPFAVLSSNFGRGCKILGLSFTNFIASSTARTNCGSIPFAN